MSTIRLLNRLVRPSAQSISSSTNLATRSFGSSAVRLQDRDNEGMGPHSTTPKYRARQTERPPNPVVPNTTSTMTKDFPSVGENASPPELLSSVNPNYKPADAYPGKIEHFTGGRQETGAQKPELGVGEMEGITFKVEPLRRTGEDVPTMRARLLCWSPSATSLR